MDKTREELHSILCKLLGSNHCYYRPPSDLRIKYPCIIYDMGSSSIKRADNIAYNRMKRWTITLIDTNPDSSYFDRLEELDYCTFDRTYVADGLNHFVFALYY